MGTVTEIGWTDHTFNPWWGCQRVSDGCRNCYAETFSRRLGRELWGATAPRQVASEKVWAQPARWNTAAEAVGRPALVFCASMADVFEDRRDLDEHRHRLFDLIESTPFLIWQLLTKRPEVVLDLVPDHWKRSLEVPVIDRFPVVHKPSRWPSNCWIGTTVEHQRAADERVPILLEVPAPVRFLSCEPLLGEVVLRREWALAGCEHLSESGLGVADPDAWRCDACGRRHRYVDDPEGPIISFASGEARHLRKVPMDPTPASIGWVIVGGESGPQHRPLDLEHARTLRDFCLDHRVPLFFKQVGGLHPKSGGDELDGERWHEFPIEAGNR